MPHTEAPSRIDREALKLSASWRAPGCTLALEWLMEWKTLEAAPGKRCLTWLWVVRGARPGPVKPLKPVGPDRAEWAAWAGGAEQAGWAGRAGWAGWAGRGRIGPESARPAGPSARRLVPSLVPYNAAFRQAFDPS
ncbi:hypothetical protein GCM10009078_48060 [Cupriavidus gilardii]